MLHAEGMERTPDEVGELYQTAMAKLKRVFRDYGLDDSDENIFEALADIKAEGDR